MNTYCLKCKRQTKNVNLKGFITKMENIQLNQHVMFVNLKKLNLYQNNKLKDFYQISYVKYLF